jgi:hypothetical protein
MLLNLDLFSAPPPSTTGDQPAATSMLDQIRTLNSMGYLAGSDAGPGGAPGADEQPGGVTQTPPSQPSDTGGVPQE